MGKFLKRVVILAVVLVPIWMLLQWSFDRDDVARSKAHAFCARFPAGSAMHDAAEAARRTAGPDTKYLAKPDLVVVQYTGSVIPWSFQSCIVTGKDGRIVSAVVRHRGS